MSITGAVSELNKEIVRLTGIRDSLLGSRNHKHVTEAPRPVKASVSRKKRTMSAEARKKIGEAVRKRWATRNKSTK